MKKLILRLLLLILPFFIAYLYVEHRLSKIPNSYNQKRKYLEAQLDKIQVLQIGGSHAFFGVNPAYFSYYGFNLANVSQTIYYDTRLISKYADKMPSLKLIIVTVSYESFRDQLRNSKEAWREYYYYTFWNINDPTLSYFAPERYSKISLYTLNETKKFSEKNFNINLAPALQYNGFEKNDSVGRSANITDRMGKERMAFLNHEMKAGYVDENFKDLEHLLKLANDKHIKVAFITLPVCNTYYKYADQNIIAQNATLVRQLCSLYQSPYFNYFTDNRFNTGDFADNDHLSYIGAEKLSKIMDSEIIKPIVSKL
jgi:hypothetical protein